MATLPHAPPLEAGIYLVHKEIGETSFGWVKALSEQQSGPGKKLRLCHGGALDPFAHGLILILAGPATKLMDALHDAPKSYEAGIAWGSETDNGDPTGKVVATADSSALTPVAIENAIRPFLGWREQVPPATSNKRIGGERAYLKAHRGEPVEVPASRVYLHSAEWISHDLPRSSRLRIVCGGGYYVRSLAKDLGRSLSCFAHLTELNRTAIGPWMDPASGARIHVAGDALLPWSPSRSVTDQERGDLRAGRAIAKGILMPGSWTPPYPIERRPVRAFHQGRLVALLKESGSLLEPGVDLGRGT